MMFNIEAFGEKVFSRRLVRYGERAMDNDPAFKAVADLFYESEKEQFKTEGKNSGGWVPLLPATLLEKQMHPGWGQTTLDRTGALRDALTGVDSEESTLRLDIDTMFVGAETPYGGFHQTGTRNMAMRKPAELREETKAEMVKIIQFWILYGYVNLDAAFLPGERGGAKERR